MDAAMSSGRRDEQPGADAHPPLLCELAGRCTDVFSVNCCFFTIAAVALGLFIPLLMPSPNQPIISAIQAKDYRRVHTLIEEQLDTMQALRDAEPLKWQGTPKPAIDDIDFGSGRRVMHVAAMHGDVSIVKYLHKRGAGVHATKDGDRRTPLHLAATFGTSEVVEALLNMGAIVDARAEGGWTPLLKAVLLSNHDIVSTLLQHGADPTAHVDDSFNALQCALIYSDSRMALLLMAAGGFVEEGENKFAEYKELRENFITHGLLKEKDIPQRNNFEHFVQTAKATAAAAVEQDDDEATQQELDAFA